MLIYSRLRLAQDLLEEADRLPGFSGYQTNEDERYHPRHEREALVNYLLLTCIDKLGQGTRHFVTLSDWLASAKPTHVSQRQQILNSLTVTPSLDSSLKALCQGYHRLYGFKNTFYSGIESLPADGKRAILESVQISSSPDAARLDPFGDDQPLVVHESFILPENDLKDELRFKYLLEKRCAFTHSLSQQDKVSCPEMSVMPGMYKISEEKDNAASWYITASIDGKMRYVCSYNDIKYDRKEKTRYLYAVHDWPFILFEVIYAALGLSFDRSSINLLFHVSIYEESRVARYPFVKHSEVKDLVAKHVASLNS